MENKERRAKRHFILTEEEEEEEDNDDNNIEQQPPKTPSMERSVDRKISEDDFEDVRKEDNEKEEKPYMKNLYSHEDEILSLALTFKNIRDHRVAVPKILRESGVSNEVWYGFIDGAIKLFKPLGVTWWDVIKDFFVCSSATYSMDMNEMTDFNRLQHDTFSPLGLQVIFDAHRREFVFVRIQSKE